MTGGDMVRNLVMAAVANEDLETQEQFYFQYWLKPIEERITLTTSISVTEFYSLYEWRLKIEVNNHWRRTKVETTGATQDYETLISRLFETFLDFETKNQVVPRHAGTA